MNNPMKNKLEVAYKEYLEFKTLLEEETKNLEQKRAEVVEAVEGLDDFEKEAEIYFNIVGYLQPLHIDVIQFRTKLYYAVEFYKDLIEIPQEILKEVKDFKVRFTFDVKAGKKEIADQEMFDHYKKQQLEISKYALSQNEQ